MKMIPGLSVFFSFWVLFFSTPLLAQSSPQFNRPGSSTPLVVSQKSRHVLSADVHAQEGRFSIGKTGLTLKKQYTFENGLPVEFSFLLDHYFLDDRTATDLPASLQSKGVNVGTKFPMPFVEGNRFFVGVDVGAYVQTAKSHGFYGDALRAKSLVYGIYRDSDQKRLILIAGVMARPGYDDSVVLPFAGFFYAINDQWSLNFLSNEPFIAYRLNEKTTVKWQFDGYHDEFDVMSGARKGDVVKISEFHAGMGVEYQMTEDVYVQLSGGWAFNREYEYIKNGGKVVPDDGFFVGYTLKTKF